MKYKYFFFRLKTIILKKIIIIVEVENIKKINVKYFFHIPNTSSAISW